VLTSEVSLSCVFEVKNGISLLFIFEIFLKLRIILKLWPGLNSECICFNLQGQLCKVLFTKLLDELQRCQKLVHLHRSPHTAPYHSACCTSCDWSSQPFCSDTNCTSWHTPIESGNLTILVLLALLQILLFVKMSFLLWKLIFNIWY
jgi:hypothetical protein